VALSKLSQRCSIRHIRKRLRGFCKTFRNAHRNASTQATPFLPPRQLGVPSGKPVLTDFLVYSSSCRYYSDLASRISPRFVTSRFSFFPESSDARQPISALASTPSPTFREVSCSLSLTVLKYTVFQASASYDPRVLLLTLRPNFINDTKDLIRSYIFLSSLTGWGNI
jgi:hypothetical protein